MWWMSLEQVAWSAANHSNFPIHQIQRKGVDELGLHDMHVVDDTRIGSRIYIDEKCFLVDIRTPYILKFQNFSRAVQFSAER